MAGTRGSLVSALPTAKLLEPSSIGSERPDLAPEAVSFRKTAQRAFYETVKEKLDPEAVVEVSRNVFAPHRVVGVFKDRQFSVDVPVLQSVDLFNNEGWEPHVALVWQDTNHSSLLGDSLSPTSYGLLIGCITRLKEQYPWVMGCLPEVRWYGKRNPW